MNLIELKNKPRLLQKENSLIVKTKITKKKNRSATHIVCRLVITGGFFVFVEIGFECECFPAMSALKRF